MSLKARLFFFDPVFHSRHTKGILTLYNIGHSRVECARGFLFQTAFPAWRSFCSSYLVQHVIRMYTATYCAVLCVFFERNATFASVFGWFFHVRNSFVILKLCKMRVNQRSQKMKILLFRIFVLSWITIWCCRKAIQLLKYKIIKAEFLEIQL